MANPRFDARSRVIWSVNIPHEARLLYLALDDMARDRGTWYEKQFTLGVKLGFSERTLRRHIATLAVCGLIRCDRTGRSSLFTLLWINSADRSNMAGQEAGRPAINVLSDRPKMAARSSRLLITSSTEDPGRSERATVCHCGAYFEGPERVRCECGMVHDPAVAAEVDPLEETRRMLAGYVSQCGLPWPEPDEEICIRTLNAAEGSIVTLRARLRFLLLDRHQSPAESYGWFPRVCASPSGSRRRSA